MNKRVNHPISMLRRRGASECPQLGRLWGTIRKEVITQRFSKTNGNFYRPKLSPEREHMAIRLAVTNFGVRKLIMSAVGTPKQAAPGSK